MRSAGTRGDRWFPGSPSFDPSCSNSGFPWMAMAPKGLRSAGHHRHSGLLASAHGAGRHRSRVPRCGAGPPVLTGPPAPASRSPRTHNSWTFHSRAGCGMWLTGGWRWRCAPPAEPAANWYDDQTTLCKARPPLSTRAGPPPLTSQGCTTNGLPASGAAQCLGDPPSMREAIVPSDAVGSP
jgi:hypothetical protein